MRQNSIIYIRVPGVCICSPGFQFDFLSL